MRPWWTRSLAALFDVQTASHGWDLRLWPIGRLYLRRKYTTGGVERRLGIYRLGRFEHAVEWWRRDGVT